MKTKLFFILFVLTTFCKAQIVNIPDIKFKNKLLVASATNVIYQFAKDLNGNYAKVDTNNDGQIQISEALQISYLSLYADTQTAINSLEGIKSFTNLSYLELSGQNLTNLDISGLSSLNYLDAYGCHIQNINLDFCNNLGSVNLTLNQLTYLNLENVSLHYGAYIDLNANPNLTSIYIKNNREDTFYFTTPGIQNLQYLCVDDLESNYWQNELLLRGVTNCQINSNCLFTPNSSINTIATQSKYDSNNNGCDINDNVISNIKYSISNGIDSYYFTGYNPVVSNGTYLITPFIENPTFFSITPSFSLINFPSLSTPYTQNFCISPVGVHNDVEIVIIPLSESRPGNNTKYKLVYKNIGTSSLNGNISFSYETNKMSFVSSSVSPTSQNNGYLTYDYSNLKSFESRTIDVELNINFPFGPNSVVAGDTLSFNSTINPIISDENQTNNNFNLNQVVINSLDPNDKICLQGNILPIEKVGDYVNYLIRFENIGTGIAQKIKIDDVIDSSKFHINSLFIVNSSHNCDIIPKTTNTIEFLFNNINLPGTPSLSRFGYIMFKIKTKSNLIVGDTFSNQANIYFDYNSPISTNNFTTIVQNTLGLQENELTNDIFVYPNPVKDFLSFKTENKIYKIEVYDIAGRILSSNSVFENKIDLSDLKTGNYILKLYTEKGIMNTKIVKE